MLSKSGKKVTSTDIYVGEFKDNLYEGQGSLYRNNKYKKGKFLHGDFQ